MAVGDVTPKPSIAERIRNLAEAISEESPLTEYHLRKIAQEVEELAAQLRAWRDIGGSGYSSIYAFADALAPEEGAK